MKAWLIGLGFSLLCSVLAVNGSAAKWEKLEGTHHVSAIATDCRCMLEHKDHMKMVLVELSYKEPNSVNMETSLPMPNGCKKINMLFTQDSEDGQFKHTCDWGTKAVQAVDLTHEDAITVRATHEKKGKTCRVFTLLTRERDVEQEKKDEFVAKAKEAGFTDDQIMIMPPEVACIESQ